MAKKAKSKIYKCSEQRRELCCNMENFAAENGQYGSGRRIFIGQSMNMETGQTGVRVWYQFGSKAKEFVLMMYCPWCSGRLGWRNPLKKKKS